MTRTCGDCSLCCKLPFVEELGKPADTWCTHCKPGRGGCTIYETRPETCKRFECEWLLHEEFGDMWKPTVAKMVMFVSRGSATMAFVNILVDLGTPNRWREPLYYASIKAMAFEGAAHNVIVRVQVGKQGWIILPQEDVEIPKGVTEFDVMHHPRTGLRSIKFKPAKAKQESENGEIQN
jgi:hypothetical protein